LWHIVYRNENHIYADLPTAFHHLENLFTNTTEKNECFSVQKFDYVHMHMIMSNLFCVSSDCVEWKVGMEYEMAMNVHSCN